MQLAPQHWPISCRQVRPTDSVMVTLLGELGAVKYNGGPREAGGKSQVALPCYARAAHAATGVRNRRSRVAVQSKSMILLRLSCAAKLTSSCYGLKLSVALLRAAARGL